MTDYLVIYERAEDGGWSAYTPDLPGCFAATATREAVERLMRQAIPFHLARMREAGQAIPEPTTSVGYVAA
jgi:predicted RNase H-like HicB family nuclease